MKVSIKLMRSLSKSNYRHFHFLSASWGSDGFLITVLMIGIMVKWGNSLKK